MLDGVSVALQARKEQEDGSVTLAKTAYRRNFWLIHIPPQFPLISKAAGRLLSAHVTSCATERNWSLFGNIFSKTRNRLALERAQKMAFIRTNSSNGLKGANEEILLSVVGVLDDEEDV